MNITSHFIGLSFYCTQFVDLFVHLQKYFDTNGLENAIEFQNILSLHITLYYLGNTVTRENESAIAKEVSIISSKYKDITILPLKSSYFTNNTKNLLCYLSCSQKETLEEINRFFAGKYNFVKASENQYPYIPHITLFKILNSDVYTLHKAKIDEIINHETSLIDSEHLIKGIHLFQVNSNFHPEIQLLVKPL